MTMTPQNKRSRTKYTVKFPLELDTQAYNNYEPIGENELHELVNFNIKNVLLTTPGERTWDNTFGVGLNELLFEQFDEIEMDVLEANIRSQIEIYVPYIFLNEIDITTSPDEFVLSIKLVYTIAQVGTSHELNVSLGETAAEPTPPPTPPFQVGHPSEEYR